MVNIIEYIKSVSLFQSLKEDEMELLATRFVLIDEKQGDTVIKESEKANALYILIKGEANVVMETDQIEFVIDELQPGQFFGEMALLDNKPRSADVVCKTDCKLLRLESSDFYNLLEQHPSILKGLVVELCSRLRKANAKLKGENNPRLYID
ncbi:hypothetical protein MTBBW1_1630003 [Desulfamplus magnetovallimortis]|uniref:Cyclic nucleotide-binding domain-containing protein n=1 Tax=Desulfamplus magnetovallimortis TaxID=1246637 RepID=A0A1W1H8W7_9BACT|nr:cyclic nucleotide-binding domain-containing protein [Desulfamplus magnetovallimortis]SLM28893.1 hypothetical protein MTBBW1_1630003 [Desulfamplus magnetovallimortis]